MPLACAQCPWSGPEREADTASKVPSPAGSFYVRTYKCPECGAIAGLDYGAAE